jgi:hypothetical protein
MRLMMNTMSVVLAAAIGVAAAACDRPMDAERRNPSDPPAASPAPAPGPTAGERAGAATETFDVKAALIADKTVDASDINVDTFAETKTVVLRGTVPTEAQKDTAERIAIREAEGYKVNNQLTVRAR